MERRLDKRKRKKSNNFTIHIHSQRLSFQQFRIDSEKTASQQWLQQLLQSEIGEHVLWLSRKRELIQILPQLQVQVEGTTPDTKAEGMKFDNEFSDLSMVYTIQEFELEKVNNYPSIKGRLKETLMF